MAAAVSRARDGATYSTLNPSFGGTAALASSDTARLRVAAMRGVVTALTSPTLTAAATTFFLLLTRRGQGHSHGPRVELHH